MINLRFSWGWLKHDPWGYDRDGHQRTLLKVVPINKMRPFSKEDWKEDYKNRIQMSNYDYRVVKDTPYDYWNGCIFVDIDYKKWVHDNPNDIISPEFILGKVFGYMRKNYFYNLYYGELSRSGYGFHFIFYYDCEKTKEMFDYYTKYTKRVVELSFEHCNLSEIIHYKGVLDTCTNSICQCCYLTRNKEVFNDDCTGELVDYPNIKVECIEQTNKTNQYNDRTTNNWNYTLKHKDDTIKNVEYIEHHRRWVLFDSLSMVFKDDTELKKEWERCSRMIPENNDHDISFYMREPYKNGWDSKLDGNQYVNLELLKQFGYTVEMKRKQTIIIEDLLDFLKHNYVI